MKAKKLIKFDKMNNCGNTTKSFDKSNGGLGKHI